MKELLDKVKDDNLNRLDIPLPIIRFYCRNHHYFKDEHPVTIGGDEIIFIMEYFFTVNTFHFLQNGDVLIQFQNPLDNTEIELATFIVYEIGFKLLYQQEDVVLIKRIRNGQRN